MEFREKVILVTGAGSGIGKQIAYRFGEKGANLVMVDLSVSDMDAAAAEMPLDAKNILKQQCDVAVEEDVKGTMDAVRKKFDKLDVIVCAAGISPNGSVTEISLQDWERTLAVDLTSIFLFSKYGIPLLKKAGGGSIISIAGTYGTTAVGKKAAYCAAKAGVINLTRQMALDYGHDGIRVNAVSPGYVDTPLNKGASREAVQEWVKTLPVPQAGQADDIAQMTLFLASEKAQYITGSDFIVDGGQIAGLG